jgi:predicted Holliday junction resolvase-like endonuclease
MLAIVIILLVLLVAVGVAFALRERRHAVHRAMYTATPEDVRKAREHSVKTSRGATRGLAAEHLAPYFPEMVAAFTAGDWRFLGTPVDFVVFDGLSDGRLERIVLVEVKSGNDAKLNERQVALRAAVNAGTARLEWLTVRGPRPSARHGRGSLLPPDAAGPAGFPDGS